MPLDEPRNGDQDPFMRLVSFHDLRSGSTPARLGATGGAGLRRLRGACVAAAIVAGGFAAPVLAAPAGEPANEADRGTAKSVDFYYAALAAARDDVSAARARGRIEAHLAASGSATADLLTTRAAVAAQAADRGLALDLVDAAIVVAPGWADARYRRGLLHLAAHDSDRARADLGEALRLEPRHIAATTALATIFESTGRKAEALRALRRLARLDPRNPALASERLERLTIEVEGREL